MEELRSLAGEKVVSVLVGARLLQEEMRDITARRRSFEEQAAFRQHVSARKSEEADRICASRCNIKECLEELERLFVLWHDEVFLVSVQKCEESWHKRLSDYSVNFLS